MKDQPIFKLRLSALALASLFVSFTARAQYADSVVAYLPGSGVSSAYTNSSAALGEPSRVTPGMFGGPVDPFNPPYLSGQLVSIGAGGSLTVSFNTPIFHDSSHPFGLDFLILGNSGFVITNGDYSGGGITDGSLFGNNPGATRVSISADNVTYYQLNPLLAPVVDGLFPTDGSGDISLPVDPALSNNDFAGKDLAGIRALYAGSGGGNGYSIAWSQDANGQSVFLPSVSFIRVDVLSGKSEIDGFAAVPEPSTWALVLAGASLLFWTRRRLA